MSWPITSLLNDSALRWMCSTLGIGDVLLCLQQTASQNTDHLFIRLYMLNRLHSCRAGTDRDWQQYHYCGLHRASLSGWKLSQSYGHVLNQFGLQQPTVLIAISISWCVVSRFLYLFIILCCCSLTLFTHWTLYLVFGLHQCMALPCWLCSPLWIIRILQMFTCSLA